MGIKNAGMCLFWSLGFEVGICAPWNCSLGFQQACRRVYIDKAIHHFVQHADLLKVLLVYRFSSGSRATRAEALEVGLKSKFKF